MSCCLGTLGSYGGNYGGGYGGNYGGGTGCSCNFSSLVVLILIILQFSRHGEDHDGILGGGKSNNGILFIIALFFLSCTGCGKGIY